MRVPWGIGVAIGLMVAGLALPALAADEALVLRQSAERLAADGRCEEAIEKAKRARTLAPEDAEAAALEGRCNLHLKRYDAAIDPLQRARALDPDLPGISTELGMAHYHRGDLAAAERELSAAEQQSPNDPRVQLYRGMVLMDRSEDDAAAARFQRAASMDASIDPIASYYAALAWQRAQERQKARESFEGVVERDPDGPWAEEARRRLADLDASTGFQPGSWSASASVGVEWNDNVVLRGDDAGLPAGISDEDDWSVWWAAEARAELFRTENWSGGVIGNYFGSAYFDLHRFDTQAPGASLWLDRKVDEKSFLRLQPFFSYTWFSTDPYLMEAGGALSYHRDFDSAGNGVLYGSYAYRDYMYNTTNPRVFFMGSDLSEERDRDGTDFRVGYEHALGVTSTTTLRAGLEHGRYEAEGNEYSHTSYGGRVGVYQQLPWRFGLDVEGSYAYEPYRHASSFPPGGNHVTRRDHYFHLRAQVDRPITDWLSAAVYYGYTNNDSNTPVFDYDQNVIGAYVTVFYGPQ
jgi:tetratricopeptide (TPR) repeat protein